MNNIMGGIIGLVVGDALGVPVEFMSREALNENPVTDMREFGTHKQPKGTWSDDSTMTLCLIESLIDELNYKSLSEKHLAWIENGYMTPHGKMFDIGGTVLRSLGLFAQGTAPLECGQSGEYDNGNGSLMRILPLAFYANGMSIIPRMSFVHNVSRLTHAHPRSLMACGIYVQFAVELSKGLSRQKAYSEAAQKCKEYYKDNPELSSFKRILELEIGDLSISDISTTPYVVDTLEAAIWCLLKTDSYESCVLKAVNLGNDTDTVGAIAGGLAGTYYGYGAIPPSWVSSIVKIDEIESLVIQFAKVCKSVNP